jgi:hypothetical protein
VSWTWLKDELRLTYTQGSYVLRQSRRAEDYARVATAVIARCIDDVAVVERTDWDGQRLPDYPVRVPRG